MKAATLIRDGGVLLLTHRIHWVSNRILDAMDSLHLTWLARS